MNQPGLEPVDAARRSRLLGLKLAALVRDHTGGAEVQPGVFAGGAALVHDDAAWVLADDRPARALGPALAWARQQRAGRLHLLADDATGVLARRAEAFTTPISVWHVEGRDLLPAIATPHEPPPPVPAEHEALRELIIAGGAEPVVEYGVLSGEVAGLEVCRAVTDPDTGAARLEVGVGAHDREAFLLLHGEIPTLDALRTVVAGVVEHRRPGAEPHPLGRLAGERRLRARLVADPALIGATTLAVAPPPVPRPNLKDTVPCAATGRDGEGRPMVVVCSVGVDLDVVPFAADARLALAAPDDRLVIAVPTRDVHPVTQALAAALVHPAEVVAVA